MRVVAAAVLPLLFVALLIASLATPGAIAAADVAPDLLSWLRHRFHLTPAPSPTAAVATRKPTAAVRGNDNDVDTMAFKVVQYNVFGRPHAVSKDGQRERLDHIPAALLRLFADIDVVTFAEVNNADERADLLAQFRKSGYNFATSVLHDPDPFTSLLNGGVLIVSKWPILHEAQHVYRNACHYSDCLAAKGVKYARVLKTLGATSKIFNVFATHMQAWSTPQGAADRIEQATQMRQFVDAIGIPHHEPLLFAGDFNVDNVTFGAEVANLVRVLDAASPEPIGDQLFTSDPRSNVLVGRDGAAGSNKCSLEYIQSWGELKNGTYYPNALTRATCGPSPSRLALRGGSDVLSTALRVFVPLDDDQCYCACCPFEWLDYVLYAQRPYQQPIGRTTLESRVLHAPQPFVVDWTAPVSNAKIELVDLSDHYPVLGTFVFPVTDVDHEAQTYHLDGCSSDADCHLHAFRCYCTGAGCYYNGTHTSGAPLDSHHPVNRNCLFQKTSFQCLCGPT